MGGSLFGNMTWNDHRDVVSGTNPREVVQDGFDVKWERRLDPVIMEYS